MSGPAREVPVAEMRAQRGISLAMLMGVMCAVGIAFTFWSAVAETSPTAAAEGDRAAIRVGMEMAEVLETADGWEIVYADTASGRRITLFQSGSAWIEAFGMLGSSHHPTHAAAFATLASRTTEPIGVLRLRYRAFQSAEHAFDVQIDANGLVTDVGEVRRVRR